MVTAICILSGVVLLCIVVIAYLALGLMMAVEQINEFNAPEVNLPPIKWDYSRESGWVDAEGEADVAEP